MSLVATIVSGVVTLGKDFFNDRKEIKQAKQALALAEINNKARLMSSQQEYNAAWEMAALKETGRALKWLSFTMLCAPIVLTMFGQYIGFNSTLMWASLKTVPEWWQNIFIAANATIWGTLQIRDMGGVGGIINAFRSGNKSENKGNKHG